MTRRALSGVIQTTGEVAFDQDRVAHVSPRVPGRVFRVRAKLGDHIKTGQTLAILDSIELGRAKADYLRARAQLQLARQNLKREEQLLKEKITSGRDVITTRAAHQKALADYRAARQRLRLLGLYSRQIDRMRYDRTRSALLSVRSAIAGRVIKKHITLGELVTPKSNLFTVADLSRVWIWIDVYERDLASVHVNDGVEVRVKTYPKRVFSGHVSYIADQIDRHTRAVRARVDVKNGDGALKPGMFAKVRLIDPHGAGGHGKRRQVLAVPAAAVQRAGKGRVVFVEVAKGRYRRTRVVVGIEADGFVEIRSGLKRGQRVVTKGAFILKSEASKRSMGQGHGH
ncbi:MAG: efflux RND transporter periplasmic adaptor subunit [Myxococcales bacterium]|nr:efflux RND transporter periplasmic adaptor subunit [Myxococcales bacterium]